MVELNNLNNKISRKFNGWNLKEENFVLNQTHGVFGVHVQLRTLLIDLIVFGKTKPYELNIHPRKLKAKQPEKIASWKRKRIDPNNHFDPFWWFHESFLGVYFFLGWWKTELQTNLHLSKSTPSMQSSRGTWCTTHHQGPLPTEGRDSQGLKTSFSVEFRVSSWIQNFQFKDASILLCLVLSALPGFRGK